VAPPEKRKGTQLNLAVGARQSTLFQFSEESQNRLVETGLVAPPAPVPRAPRVAPLPIALPGTLTGSTATPEGIPRIPDSVVENWTLPHELRDYQQEGLDALLEQHKGTAYLPPAAGKTLLATAAIEELRVPTVVVVPTRVLVDQWRRELAKAGIHAGVYYGDEKAPSWVTISTYQSLYQFPDVIRKYPFIVFDETDLVTADDFSALLRETAEHPYVLAMTGTRPTDDLRVRALEDTLPILVERTLADLGDVGHVIVPDIVPEGVPLTPGEKEQYDKIQKQLMSAASEIRGGVTVAKSILQRSGDAELRAAALRFMHAWNERIRLVNYAQNKAAAVVKVARGIPDRKVLLFGTAIEPLDAACVALGQAGVGCRVLSGTTPTRERGYILDNWGVTFKVLASAKVLERGFNVPEVSSAIIIGSGSGAQQILQRFGRIARPAPGKTAATAYLIYASGTFEDELAKRMKAVIEKGK
jgi:superfamily II DNA or RNA helicase